jgi:hypothetical protein
MLEWAWSRFIKRSCLGIDAAGDGGGENYLLR